MSEKTQRRESPVEIEINGTKYPYRETMGAMLAFKEDTGLDSPSTLEDSLKYMYYVVRSAARREGKEFALSFEEFADGLDGDEYLRVTGELTARANAKAEASGKNAQSPSR